MEKKMETTIMGLQPGCQMWAEAGCCDTDGVVRRTGFSKVCVGGWTVYVNKHYTENIRQARLHRDPGHRDFSCSYSSACAPDSAPCQSTLLNLTRMRSSCTAWTASSGSRLFGVAKVKYGGNIVKTTDILQILGSSCGPTCTYTKTNTAPTPCRHPCVSELSQFLQDIHEIVGVLCCIAALSRQKSLFGHIGIVKNRLTTEPNSTQPAPPSSR